VEVNERIEYNMMKWEGKKLQKDNELKNEDVLNIRKLYEEGVSGYRLHKIYNVTKKCISDILNNKTWKYLRT
jgi:hypothetical protein